MSPKVKKVILAILVAILVLSAAFWIYLSFYSKADETALAAMESSGSVTVTATDYGWFFDGPSEDTALVFYPGAKVEAKAYAPLLRLLAESGTDVCLAEMPARMAMYGINKADKIMAEYTYDNWFVGGHSLGGWASEKYASDHEDRLRGVVLFAARPRNVLTLPELVLCGSEDSIVQPDKYFFADSQSSDDAPEATKGRSQTELGNRGLQSGGGTLTIALGPNVTVEIIEGGNHAQFGSYGLQTGDGTATISAEAQREEAVRLALNWMKEHSLSMAAAA